LRVDDLADSWPEELGDLLFSLICMANATNVDLEQSLSRVLEKYAKRLEARQDAGSGH
jgi:NTP pyrophosphatase (non-canonical NTP hydrolase)